MRFDTPSSYVVSAINNIKQSYAKGTVIESNLMVMMDVEDELENENLRLGFSDEIWISHPSR
jgi:hypothetical protein